MGKTEIVLMITEGEKLDIRILKKLKSIFLPQKEVEIFPICLNIYNLYKKLSENDGFGSDFIDVFSVIKEIIQEQPSSNDPEFLKLNRNQISEIFLFFDYDGHDTLASRYPNSIVDMLALFDNET
ncbi:Uncharacterised protein [Actinobacillus lignieresii]|uniref:hypothetical protein n=1 Tax=Actinobacillus lignieresii TaxID=720 RepID=UPI000E17A4F3|nr:hypothetical protein [Actinobacillus lignieresii]SUT98556.1 Uncharacterised protein [Actinobacillus lignieresii]